MVSCPLSTHKDGRGQGLGGGFFMRLCFLYNCPLTAKCSRAISACWLWVYFKKDAAKWFWKPRIGVTKYYNFSSYTILQIIYPFWKLSVLCWWDCHLWLGKHQEDEGEWQDSGRAFGMSNIVARIFRKYTLAHERLLLSKNQVGMYPGWLRDNK